MVGGAWTLTEDPHPDVPCERRRAGSARVLPCHRTGRLRVVRLPRRAPAAVRRRSDRRRQLLVHPGRTVVVDRDHDDGRLRRPVSALVPRHAGRVGLRAARRSHAQPTAADHRQQLRTVLLAHAGAR